MTDEIGVRNSTVAMWLVALLFGALALSCESGEQRRADIRSDTPRESSPSPQLRAEAETPVRVGDSVTLRLFVANPTEEGLQLCGSLPDEGYQFVIRDEAGEEVWQTEWPIRGGAAIWTLAPRQEMERVAVWPTIRSDQGEFEPGNYNLTGRIFLCGADPESPPFKITVLPSP